MVFIQKQVKVIDWQGNILESTYVKRALQLVKNERAIWVSSDTICLIRQSRRKNDIEPSTHEESSAIAVNDDQEKAANTLVLNDKMILDLAKRRLAAKRNINGQILDFFLIILCMFGLIGLYSTESRFIIAMIFCALWGTRLLVRIVKFAKPSFKDGIVAYFRERNEQKLESEYSRLKKMSTEYVINQLDK